MHQPWIHLSHLYRKRILFLCGQCNIPGASKRTDPLVGLAQVDASVVPYFDLLFRPGHAAKVREPSASVEHSKGGVVTVRSDDESRLVCSSGVESSGSVAPNHWFMCEFMDLLVPLRLSRSDLLESLPCISASWLRSLFQDDREELSKTHARDFFCQRVAGP